MKSLSKMCAGRAVLPRSLHFKTPEDPTTIVLRHGGFADVSKLEHRGQAVAVKVLRPHSNSNLQEMTNVCYWRVVVPFYTLTDRAWPLQRFCKEIIT